MAARTEIDFAVYNPFSRDFIHDPWPTWDRLLADYPIAYHRDMGVWGVFSHELCFEALKSPLLTPSFRASKNVPLPKPDAEKTDFDRRNDHSLFSAEPAAHMRLRKLTVPAFAKQVMDQIEEKIRDLIIGVFDEIGTPEEFDAATQVAGKIPIRAISRMSGVPRDAEDLFEHGLAYNLVYTGNPLISAEQRAAAMEATLPGFALLKELIAERRGRANPGDDFLGTLVGTIDENGDRLSDWDIISLISALVVAGADTVTDLHTYGIMEMLTHRDQWQLLRQRPELMENTTLEILRHGGMGKTGVYRFPLQEIDLGGERIGKGETIMVSLQPAWNDPKKWPEPRRFDIARPQDGNLIFGAGPHFCIGLNLVKVQGKLMINELSRRFPEAELVGDFEYDYSHHNARRFTRMPVKTILGAKSGAAA